MRISFNCAAQIYDKTRSLPSQVMKQLVKTLIGELGDCRTILDLGVGTGRFAKPLQDSGLEVVGVDIAEKMIDKAVERGVDNLLKGDACFLPLKNNSFDATVCIHLLHLINEWKTALQEICRVTQSVMVSMAYGNTDPVWETYNRLLKSCGYESHRLGKGEGELKDLVKPLKSVFVASFSESADGRLAHMSERAYSSQWEIPEDVNKEVMDELNCQFAGRMFAKELQLLVWDVNDLEVFFIDS